MKSISAQELDEKFDNGEDISEYLDWSSARSADAELENIDVDLPVWILQSLDHEASKLGVTRQVLMQRWLAERLEAMRAK